MAATAVATGAPALADPLQQQQNQPQQQQQSLNLVAYVRGALAPAGRRAAYASPWTCQAMLRALPALAQQHVLRLLYVDAPVPEGEGSPQHPVASRAASPLATSVPSRPPPSPPTPPPLPPPNNPPDFVNQWMKPENISTQASTLGLLRDLSLVSRVEIAAGGGAGGKAGGAGGKAGRGAAVHGYALDEGFKRNLRDAFAGW
jgi:hypothetical protein